MYIPTSISLFTDNFSVANPYPPLLVSPLPLIRLFKLPLPIKKTSEEVSDENDMISYQARSLIPEGMIQSLYCHAILDLRAIVENTTFQIRNGSFTAAVPIWKGDFLMAFIAY